MIGLRSLAKGLNVLKHVGTYRDGYRCPLASSLKRYTSQKRVIETCNSNGMICVLGTEGIGHSPWEHTELADCAGDAEVLYRVIRTLDQG